MEKIQKTLVFLIALTFLVIVVSLFSFSVNPTGKASTDSQIPPCSDSDKGIDSAEKGSVVFEGVKYVDVCIGEYTLKENYCTSDGQSATKNHVCKDSCYEGKCIDGEKSLNFIKKIINFIKKGWR